MLDENSWRRIARYALGECSAGEAVETWAWIEADPERRRVAEELTRLADAGPTAVWDAGAAWERFTAGPAQPSGAAPSAGALGTGRGRTRWWIAAAAGLTLAAGSSALWLTSRSPASDAATPAVRDVVTRRGERAVFDLSDGSRVMLGAESRLRIPADYNSAAGGRHLMLEGEAYFEVQHDSTLPFLVQTPAGYAEDLGTEFVVTAYPETQGMRVVVQSGIVALRGPAQRAPNGLRPVDTMPLLTLTAGDLARLDRSGVATLTRGADIRPYLAWTEGTLLFDGTRLDSALTQLARWYDLDIGLADPSLGALQLTATFRNEPAPQMLRLLALALDLKVDVNGRRVTLSSRSYPRHWP